MGRSVAQMFGKVYNNQRNVITPNLVEYGAVGEYVYEISRGKGIAYKEIYGVTFLGKDCSKQPGMNEAFSTFGDAKKYIDKIGATNCTGAMI